jgi:hypothetical protein
LQPLHAAAAEAIGLSDDEGDIVASFDQLIEGRTGEG